MRRVLAASGMQAAALKVGLSRVFVDKALMKALEETESCWF